MLHNPNDLLHEACRLMALKRDYNNAGDVVCSQTVSHGCKAMLKGVEAIMRDWFSYRWGNTPNNIRLAHKIADAFVDAWASSGEEYTSKELPQAIEEFLSDKTRESLRIEGDVAIGGYGYLYEVFEGHEALLTIRREGESEVAFFDRAYALFNQVANGHGNSGALSPSASEKLTEDWWTLPVHWPVVAGFNPSVTGRFSSEEKAQQWLCECHRSGAPGTRAKSFIITSQWVIDDNPDAPGVPLGFVSWDLVTAHMINNKVIAGVPVLVNKTIS